MPGLMENSVLDLELQVVENVVPETVLGTADAALLVSVFATTARISLLNAESDVAADLCAAVATIGSALHGPPAAVPTALLCRASDWASSVLDLLGAGIWTSDRSRRPAAVDQDGRLAAQLEADLDAIRRRLRY